MGLKDETRLNLFYKYLTQTLTMKEGLYPNINKSATESEKRPSLLEEYQRYKDTPPNVKEKKPMSLEELAQKEECTLADLENNLKIKIAEFSEKMAKNISYPSEEYFELIDSIYNLYLQSQNNTTTEDNSWVNSFKSFDSFMDHFCPEATPHAQAAIKKNIQIFVRAIVNQEEIINIHPRDWLGVNSEGIKEIYNTQGNWILLPGDGHGNGIFDYTDSEIIEEVIKLVKEEYRPSDFTHSSGSAALNGIEQSGSILSAQEVTNRKMKVSTGEHVSYINQSSGTPVAGGRYGLNSVYASKGGYSPGYCHINWFDEYYVAFGINKQKQDDFLSRTGFKHDFGSTAESESHFLDMGSEGIEIGNEVPLSTVETVYYWKRNQEKMTVWAQKNCPNAKLVSIEASEILTSHGYIVNKIAEQEKVSVEEAWEKIK